MPLKNFHACRIKNPILFKKESFRTLHTKTKGLTFITGILKSTSKSTLQSYRYAKANWASARANKHCNNRGGSIEAASKEAKKMIVPSDIPNLLVEGANTAYMAKPETGLAYKICIIENMERGKSIKEAKKECVNFKKSEEVAITLTDEVENEAKLDKERVIDNFIKKETI